jgi:hypothetical protein
MTCSTTGPKTSRRLSEDMTFAPAGPSSHLQSLRISSQADASTLMQFSHITTPPSPPTNTRRKSGSLSSPLCPLTLLKRLNLPLTGSPHGEELSGLTNSSSHSGLMSSDSTESSSRRCSPNTSPSVTSALFNAIKQSGNESGVVVSSSSLISLTSWISRRLTYSPLAPSTTPGLLPNLTLEDAPETGGHACSTQNLVGSSTKEPAIALPMHANPRTSAASSEKLRMVVDHSAGSPSLNDTVAQRSVPMFACLPLKSILHNTS